jgi:hypothetical protein
VVEVAAEDNNRDIEVEDRDGTVEGVEGVEGVAESEDKEDSAYMAVVEAEPSVMVVLESLVLSFSKSI